MSSRVACRRWMVPYDRGVKCCAAGAERVDELLADMPVPKNFEETVWMESRD